MCATFWMRKLKLATALVLFAILPLAAPMKTLSFQEIEHKLALGLQRVKMQRNVGVGDLLAARRTYKAFQNKPCDIIHGHGAKGGLYARLFGAMMRRNGRKVASIYSPHGGSLHYSKSSLKGRVFLSCRKGHGEHYRLRSLCFRI